MNAKTVDVILRSGDVLSVTVILSTFFILSLSLTRSQNRETDTKLTTTVTQQHISAYCNEATLPVNLSSLKID